MLILLNLWIWQPSKGTRKKLGWDNINEPPIRLLTGRNKQGLSFVYVISPAAHGDRNVSQTLWLTKDRSTPRSQGNWSIVGNGFPVAILNTPGHLPPCVVSSWAYPEGTFFLLLCKDYRTALTETSHPMWWLLNTAWQPRALSTESLRNYYCICLLLYFKCIRVTLYSSRTHEHKQVY